MKSTHLHQRVLTFISLDRFQSVPNPRVFHHLHTIIMIIISYPSVVVDDAVLGDRTRFGAQRSRKVKGFPFYFLSILLLFSSLPSIAYISVCIIVYISVYNSFGLWNLLFRRQSVLLLLYFSAVALLYSGCSLSCKVREKCCISIEKVDNPWKRITLRDNPFTLTKLSHRLSLLFLKKMSQPHYECFVSRGSRWDWNANFL